ncbi:Salicylate hydroxylase [Psilocybe cubensis]|uniref:Salicylate hydroxylase n=2 Tax=Psilocybe cubensis TaxID=181762 RepID=A0ACB8GTG9_PSICU|nr:Salicylate hydroxylase [Psilocybe cubensis]KAH9478727.1 Salicylate hydroxylase [Psilocybe cubensis]
MTSQKLRIAIVGGGIGGLTLAVALSHLNLDKHIQVDIYESTAKLTQVGAGITIWPRGREILKNIGVEASLAERLPGDQELPALGVPKLAFIIRKSDKKIGEVIAEVMLRGGSISIHRADVQEVLLKHISPSVKFHLAHRLNTYRRTKNGIELEFKNGESVVCDLLVGADGINSAVRQTFISEGQDWSEEERIRQAAPVWSGTYVYRDLIDSEVVRRVYPTHSALTKPMVYCGKDKHIVAYPVRQGKFVNMGIFLSYRDQEGTYHSGPTVVDSMPDECMPHFEDWEEEARVLVKLSSKPSKWAVQTTKPLDTYAKGRVLLLGDAAHAMTVHLGNGAGQAMEDAYILANLISKATQEKLDAVKIAEVYSAVRQPFVNFVVQASRNQGLIYELNAPGLEDLKDGDDVSREDLDKLADLIRSAWDWTIESADDGLRKALAML